MSDKIKELLAKESFDINDLADIVVILRSENGCPWDKVQTHKSIKKDFLEEVYEVMEAIDCDSPEMMREELGEDRKSTRLNSSHYQQSRMPSSA